jgi:N-acetylglucosaminyldiphosphoundecaprenol N-acetyl-beta-D-mannosaminyltransferase
VEPGVKAEEAVPPSAGEMPREIHIPESNVTIHDVSFDETVDLIVKWAREGSGGYVSTPNLDHLVRAKRDPAFRKLVMGARLRIPDGMGLIYASRLRGKPFRGAVTGRLLPEAIVRATKTDPIPIAMIGGRDDAPERATKFLKGLGGNVVAAVSPQMGFAIGSAVDNEATAMLKDSDPRVVLVGFGAPKQEQWMARHQADMPQAVMLGIGQAIDILGGRVPAAPSWMTKIGLEWAFRMLRDPRRIGRRVFVDDPPFFWWMLKARVRERGT